MKKLLLLFLFLSGCVPACMTGACYDAVLQSARERAGGKEVYVRKAFRGSWYVKRGEEFWVYYTGYADSCDVSGKERIF